MSKERREKNESLQGMTGTLRRVYRAGLILCFCAGLISCVVGIQKSRIQELPVRAVMNETDAGIQNRISLGPVHDLVPGKTYKVWIRYEITDQVGWPDNALFSDSSVSEQHLRRTADRLAQYGCSALETEFTLVPQKSNVRFDLTLAIVPERLTDPSGQVFDLKTMRLDPVLYIEEQDG